jgi:two-component system, LuxR family, response regulator FixJ
MRVLVAAAARSRISCDSHDRYMLASVSKMTLVVVDDDGDIRRAVGRSLRSYGHEVHLFESGEAYLAKSCDADCAIVDIGLPGVSGLEVEERMRRGGRHIPVVFITAHDDLARRAIQRTTMPVLKKPLDEHDLLDAIAQVTGDRST